MDSLLNKYIKNENKYELDLICTRILNKKFNNCNKIYNHLIYYDNNIVYNLLKHSAEFINNIPDIIDDENNQNDRFIIKYNKETNILILYNDYNMECVNYNLSQLINNEEIIILLVYNKYIVIGSLIFEIKNI